MSTITFTIANRDPIDTRASLVAALHFLLTWLEAHPDVDATYATAHGFGKSSNARLMVARDALPRDAWHALPMAEGETTEHLMATLDGLEIMSSHNPAACWTCGEVNAGHTCCPPVAPFMDSAPGDLRSTAERIAQLLGRDGQRWTVPDGTDDAGLTLADLCAREPGVAYRDLRAGGAVAVFTDGSGIWTGDTGWDVVAQDGESWVSVDRNGRQDPSGESYQ